MSQRTYISASRLTLPVVVDGKVERYVNFYDEKNTFTTEDVKVQQALEALPAFGRLFSVLRSGPERPGKAPAMKRGNAAGTAAPPPPPVRPLSPTPSDFSEKGKETDGTGETDVKEMPEITDWQAAREVLKAEPYEVPYQALASPEAILKKAEEKGLRFPNLTLL